MSLRNPTINPPRFARPGQSRSPSRSPSQSPVRRERNFSQDPILRDLSPTKTLRVLTSETGDVPRKSEDRLWRSLQKASPAEKEFVTRVAQTCKNLKAWTAEVEAWEWPGTFEPPPVEERPAKRQRMLAEHGYAPGSIPSDGSDIRLGDDTGGFWGSLPKEIVQEHEARIEDISAAIDELDLENIKDHIRTVHLQAREDDSARPQGISSSRMRVMNDLTALVTATVLQSLPYMSWLNRLMNEWSLRLTIMRKVPGYLRGLTELGKSLQSASDDLMMETERNEEVAGPLQKRFEAIQAGFGAKVSILGQRLDSMLDDLEGRPETLPELWIDQFEGMEAAYTDWVVESERMIMNLSWKRSEQAQNHDKSVLASFDALDIPEKESPDHFSTLPPVSPWSEKDDFFATSDNRSSDQRVSPADSTTRAESPVLGEPRFQFFHHDESLLSVQDTSRGRQESVRPRQDIEFSRLVDDVIAESQDQAQMPQNVAIGVALAHDNPISNPTAKKHSRTLSNPDSPARSMSKISFSRPQSPSKGSTSPSRSETSSHSRPRSRHRPIEIDAYRDVAYGLPGTETSEETASFSQTPPLPKLVVEVPNDSIQARKALFAGDLERKQILLKARSPVRPFEHASTAFTKLFQATAAREQASKLPPKEPSRSISKSSRRSSLRHAITPASTNIRTSGSSKRTSGQSIGSTANGVMPDAAINEISTMDVNESVSTRGNSLQSDQRSRPASKPDWSDKEIVVGPVSSGHVRQVSETKSRFDSPFMTQEPNWPLSPHDTAVEEEISSPERPFQSDFFERMFVDTLPTSPSRQDETLNLENNPVERAFIENTRKPIATREPPADSSLLDGVYSHAAEDLRMERTKVRKSERTVASLDSEADGLAGSISDVGATGSLRSAQSTPEIHDATQGGYFQAKTVQTPPLKPTMVGVSRRASSSGSRKHSSVSPMDRFDLGVPPEAVDKSFSNEETVKPKRRSMEKRASVASIEHFARSELKTVAIQRNSSVSSAGEDPVQAYQNARLALEKQQAMRVRSTPSSPRLREVDKFSAQSQSNHERLDVPPRTLRTDSERSFIASSLGAPKPKPLDMSLVERRRSLQQDEANAGKRPETPLKSERRRDSVSSVGGDNMDRHVSSVLRNLPARIRFNAKPNNGPQQGAAASTRASKLSRPGDLTLAPATPANSTPTTATETKVYHLTSPSRAEPLKLFIRLVGENERVMVRVGGGWMDLADFLRQYAEHHTSRTLSAGIEVAEAPTPGSKAPMSGTKAKATPLSRAGTVDGYDFPSPGSGGKRASAGTSGSTSARNSDVFFSSPNWTSKEDSAGSGDDGVGLAGERKVGDLDENRRKWVDEMIARTKAASSGNAEKRLGKDGWSDAGKVQGTRRIAFRGE